MFVRFLVKKSGKASQRSSSMETIGSKAVCDRNKYCCIPLIPAGKKKVTQNKSGKLN